MLLYIFKFKHVYMLFGAYKRDQKTFCANTERSNKAGARSTVKQQGQEQWKVNKTGGGNLMVLS